ncbi:MAG TPA: DUF1232 domain-containing protein [Anaerolineae bacterium]|nr:DUF1232 domain-containing protein [Anaerolineae bacterium]
MSKRSTPRTSIWVAAKRQARLIFELMRDSRVPIWMRLIPLVGIVYLLSPIELMPDIALLPFGLIDDLVVIIICLTIFLALAPKDIVDDHRGWLDAADITIDDLQETRRLPPNGEEKD